MTRLVKNSEPHKIIPRIFISDGIFLCADYFDSDSDVTVVLLHGGGQTRHSWSLLMEKLSSAGFNVLNYDARGHGDSGWSLDGSYRYTDYANDLVNIVKSIKGRYIFIGASMGGLTAMTSVKFGLSPELIILVDIVVNPSLSGLERIHQFMTAGLEGFESLEQAADAVAVYKKHKRRPDDYSGLTKNLRLRGNKYFWHWDPSILSKDLHQSKSEMAELALDYAATLKNKPIKTILISGSQSDVVTAKNINEMKDLIPSLEVEEVLGAGHMVASDQNDKFNLSVIKILNSYFAN